MDRIKLIGFLLFTVLCSTAQAGINVCPNVDGPISSFRLSGNPQSNCHYFQSGNDANYNLVKSLLQTTPKRFLDIVGKNIVKKSQFEIDAILLAEQIANDSANDLLLRNNAKGYMDNLESQGLALRALAEIIRVEINILRAEHALAPRTLNQLKNSIKSKIDSGEVD